MRPYLAMDISRIVCQRLTSYIEMMISILPKASVNAEIIRPLISQTTLAYILIHVFARSRRYDFRVAHHSPPPPTSQRNHPG